MWKLDRRASATLALMALTSLAGITPLDAQGEELRATHEHRSPEGARQAARREVEARQSRRTYPARAPAVHAAARPVVSDHREMVARSISERRPEQVTRRPAGGQVRVVRYGSTLSGTVERTIRPGLMSRTFVSGGHVVYTHLYQRHVWHQFGRAFAYETFVPAVRYPGIYYAWALGAWPRPVAYSLGLAGATVVPDVWLPIHAVSGLHEPGSVDD